MANVAKIGTEWRCRCYKRVLELQSHIMGRQIHGLFRSGAVRWAFSVHEQRCSCFAHDGRSSAGMTRSRSAHTALSFSTVIEDQRRLLIHINANALQRAIRVRKDNSKATGVEQKDIGHENGSKSSNCGRTSRPKRKKAN